jgi:TATA-binding protein-associated factor
MAKAGVALAGAGVAFWLLQKVVSTVITLAVIGAGLYFYLGRSGGASDEGAASSSSRRSGGGNSNSNNNDDDDDDPLAEARRIMSKYTK